MENWSHTHVDIHPSVYAIIIVLQMDWNRHVIHIKLVLDIYKTIQEADISPSSQDFKEKACSPGACSYHLWITRK